MNGSLKDELFGIRQWLQLNLETKIESRHSTDVYGRIVNTWAAVPIPDWDVKQKIQRIDEALAGVRHDDGA